MPTVRREVSVILTCGRCKEQKDESEFNKDSTKASGRQTVCRSCSKARYREYRYGLDQTTYDALIAAQGGACAICHVQFNDDIAPVVDHDHTCCPTKSTCGRCVRGILCGPCNSLIGMAEDDLEILQSAIHYLDRQVI